jgi:hypothetical protein
MNTTDSCGRNSSIMRNLMTEAADWIVIAFLSILPLTVIAIFFYGLFCIIAPAPACSMEKLGRISRNPFIGDSTANPFSMYNNPFNPKSPYNRFGPYGNPFSPYSANNPFATETPTIYGHADEGSSEYSETNEDYSAYAAEGGYQ